MTARRLELVDATPTASKQTVGVSFRRGGGIDLGTVQLRSFVVAPEASAARQAREAAGLSTRELGELLRVRAADVEALERGERVPASGSAGWAEILGAISREEARRRQALDSDGRAGLPSTHGRTQGLQHHAPPDRRRPQRR